MRAICVGVMLTAVIAVAPVSANVPPVSWRQSSFVGPGILCGAAFTFALKAGETATNGFPSEEYDPVYIKSHGGSFSIISHSFNAPELEKRKISSGASGSEYIVTKIVRDFASGVSKRQMYWFEPSQGTPFSVIFYAAVPGEWGDFPTSEYRNVLTRVKFAEADQQPDCLTPTPS